MKTHTDNAPALLADDQCPACGSKDALAAFHDETWTARLDGLIRKVPHLSGERCRVCGEAFPDAESAMRYSAASDELVAQARLQAGQQLRRVRRKLGLSQAEAATIAGGGHNAFSRYERGQAQPVAAVFHLFELLDKHPDLLEEILPPAASPSPPR